MLRHFLGLFKTMQAMLPVILILLLPCIALASTATRATPEQLRKCKFQQPWSFLDCYHEKSDFPTYWIVIVE